MKTLLALSLLLPLALPLSAAELWPKAEKPKLERLRRVVTVDAAVSEATMEKAIDELLLKEQFPTRILGRASSPPSQDAYEEAVRRWAAAGFLVVTNEVRTTRFESVLSTNWLPMNLERANGDGTTRWDAKEIGVVVSNRYAVVLADGATNRMLLSSQALLPERLLMREKADVYSPWGNTITNIMFSTNWVPRWHIVH